MASCWSGRRGSNSLPPPWQGGALPDELRPHIRCIYPCTLPFVSQTGPPRKLANARFCGEEEKFQCLSQRSCFARLPDKRLTFRRGASDRNRTNDTGIFSPLLYRLSYRGIESAFIPALPRIRFLNRGPPQKLANARFCGEEEKVWRSSQRSCWQDCLMNRRTFDVVPPIGIEPMTRGFSVPCSTD